MQKWKDLARMEKAFYIFSVTMVFCALAYPIGRMSGAIFQIHNETPNSLKGRDPRPARSGYRSVRVGPKFSKICWSGSEILLKYLVLVRVGLRFL